MKRILFLSIAAIAVLAGCQKPYVRREIQKEDEAKGTEIRYGLSNCFIAYQKESVTFDVKAYPISELNFTLFKQVESTTAPAADSVGVVWVDGTLKVTDIQLDKAKKEVTATLGGTSGNALVAIYNEGKILWSFHIWKPRVNPDSLLHYASIGADVMPLNLGAEDLFKGQPKANTAAYIDRTCGLFYQWGRKDPLGRPALKAGKGYQKALNAENVPIDWDSDVASTATAYGKAKSEWKEANAEKYDNPDSLETAAQAYINIHGRNIIRDYAIQHPTTFIYPSATYNTFNMTGGQNQWQQKEQWKGDLTINRYWYELKNAYDPCPEGYMLPPMKLYRGFISAATYIVDDEGEGGNSFSVNTYEGINADLRTKDKMETYGGFNLLYFGSLDSAKTTFFPACGYRLGYNASTPGALTEVGIRGRYCGYTSTASYIRIFYFTANTLSAQYGYNPHATANQVRCIKEMSFSEDEE